MTAPQLQPASQRRDYKTQDLMWPSAPSNWGRVTKGQALVPIDGFCSLFHFEPQKCWSSEKDTVELRSVPSGVLLRVFLDVLSLSSCIYGMGQERPGKMLHM